ncbi:MAG: hypothetical protein OXF30_01055 [Candidatus Saccharibacteria bacterium]|nr:hypothetical protein [Candidatus Saccharibacteria bacterium]
MKFKNRITMDEGGVQLYATKIASIFKVMGKPLPSAKSDDYRRIMAQHTSKEGKVNLPKMLRNATAYQVLAAMLDCIKNTIFTYQYLKR